LTKLPLTPFEAHAHKSVGTIHGITRATVFALATANAQHIAIVVARFTAKVIKAVIEGLAVDRFCPTSSDR
jgi:hypothetical protein|tara:strand:+ start:256 stop:468 length:213 start_codon:yes stop_codon:yes gene_type:complete